MTSLVAALRAPRAGFLDASVLRMRVAPGDLDLNGHMNNGRYLALMDIGRLDLAVRVGFLGIAWRRRWRPLLGSATIRFRRSLQPFQRFTLRTRLLGWDDKWLVFEQRFEAGGATSALALARALFRGPGGNVAPAEALAGLGITDPSPALPDYVADWSRADAAAWAAGTTTP